MALGAGLLIALAVVIGTLLARASAGLQADDDAEIERINALLPQTQCGQCGYPGCRPYAEALLQGAAEIDQCPPGGEATARALGRAARQPQHAAHASRCQRPVSPSSTSPRASAARAVSRCARWMRSSAPHSSAIR